MADTVKQLLAVAHRTPRTWVRLEAARWEPTALVLRFGIADGKRGRPVSRWELVCRGVREAHLSNVDGGGLRQYPTRHPAAHQFWAPRAELRVESASRELEALQVALWAAHRDAVLDWIPVERYLGEPDALRRRLAAGRGRLAQGPAFLLRAYAAVLRARGVPYRLIVKAEGRRPARRVARPQVVHFGESYVIAEAYSAADISTELANDALERTRAASSVMDARAAQRGR